MADSETGLKWWLRYVVVPLLGGGTVISLVVAAFLNRGPTEPPQKASERTAAVAPEPTAAIRELVTRFLDAYAQGNVDEVTSLSGVPYYTGKRVVTSKGDQWEWFVQSFKGRNSQDSKPKILAIGISSLRELPGGQYQAISHDKDLELLHLSPDDYGALVQLENSQRQILLFVRKRSAGYEVSGFYN